MAFRPRLTGLIHRIVAGPTISDAPVRRITRRQLGWRIAAGLVGIALVANGSLRMSDDVWPFGPMSQYAFTPGLNDTVVITRVNAQLSDGRRIELPLTNGESGIARAEVEAQIPAIENDPALLSAVADGWARAHPGSPRPVQVWLVQETDRAAGRTADRGSTSQLAHWVVPG